MRNFRNMIVMAAVALGSTFAMAAQAKTYSWVFATSGNSGNVGSAAHTYLDTTSTVSLSAHGYSTAKSDTGGNVINNMWNTGTVSDLNLYNKYTAGNSGETGLGLNGTLQSEIGTTNFIQFDVANLIAGKYTNLIFNISSIQKGEGYSVWGSNLAGTPGSLLKTFTYTNGASVSNSFVAPLFGTYDYYSIGATSGNVLVQNGVSVDAPAVPEASTSAGFSGLLVIGGLSMVRRRRVAAKKLA
jgi:hypothetical protein